MKSAVIFCGVFLLLVTACGCEISKSGQDNSAFNTAPTMLAVLPAGYDLLDAVFSANGKHVMIAATKDGKVSLFYDSQMSMSYDEIRGMVFRNGYSDHAYVARKGEKNTVVVKGVLGKPYDSIGIPIFIPDGNIVYPARLNNHWFIVAGNNIGQNFDSSSPAPAIITNGNIIAYAERKSDANKYNLNVCSPDLKECVKGKDYDFITGLIANSSNKAIAYIAVNNGKTTVVNIHFSQTGIVESEGRWYDEVSIARYSNNGDHIAYLAKAEHRAILVKDGVETMTDNYDVVFDMAVSAQGKVIHSAILKGQVAAYIDGKKRSKAYNGVDDLRLSPDGDNYVFSAEKGDKSIVVINGKETQIFDRVVTPKFSPDGSKIVYRARSKGERFVVVADLKGRAVREHPHYESVWDVSFSSDGKLLGYGVKTGQEFWWKVEKLNEE